MIREASTVMDLTENLARLDHVYANMSRSPVYDSHWYMCGVKSLARDVVCCSLEDSLPRSKFTSVRGRSRFAPTRRTFGFDEN